MCRVSFWVVIAAFLSVGLRNFTSRVLRERLGYVPGMLPRTTVGIWPSVSCLCVHLRRGSLYRFILLSLNSNNSPKNWTNRTRFSKQLSTGFAFTNTDSDDVTWGCSQTVIVSVIVGFRNLSNYSLIAPYLARENWCSVLPCHGPLNSTLHAAQINTLMPKQNDHLISDIFKRTF